MAYIKGPIVMKNPGNVVDAIRRQFGNQQQGSVKLPFVATGWKSTKMPSMDVIGIDSKAAVSHSELDTKPSVEKPVEIAPIPTVEMEVAEESGDSAEEADELDVKPKSKKKRRSI